MATSTTPPPVAIPPASILPVTYAHTIDYFEKGIDERGPYYNVQYQIANWSDSDLFINALLGYVTIAGQGSSGGIVKRQPHAHPLSPNLLCCRAKCMGLGYPVLNEQGLPNYSGGALIQAEYRAPQWQAYPDGNQTADGQTSYIYCTQEIELSTEIYTIPSKRKTGATTLVYNTADTDEVDADFRLYVPIAHLNLTFFKLPYIPMAAFRAYRGYVNTQQFLGAPAGCVLFKSGRISRDYDTTGSIVQTVQMAFAERSTTQPWNSLPNPSATVGDDGAIAWTPVWTKTNHVKMYPTGDLNNLLIF